MRWRSSRRTTSPQPSLCKAYENRRVVRQGACSMIAVRQALLPTFRRCLIAENFSTLALLYCDLNWNPNLQGFFSSCIWVIDHYMKKKKAMDDLSHYGVRPPIPKLAPEGSLVTEPCSTSGERFKAAVESQVCFGMVNIENSILMPSLATEHYHR